MGNVLVTISDRKNGVPNAGNTAIDYYTAEVITANDYYPFGMQMPGRKYPTIASYTAQPVTGGGTSSTPIIAYKHSFDVAISSYPYTNVPDVQNYISNSVWTNSIGAWVNYQGSPSSTNALAISSSPATGANLNLDFDIAPDKILNITSFSFYNRSSPTGYSVWTLLINGVTVGTGNITVNSSGTLGFTGLQTILNNAASNLTGHVIVTLALSARIGSLSTGTFRFDQFTLNGYVMQQPEIPGSSSGTDGSGRYRYGFNTQEKDNEIYGEGNAYAAEYWEYDSRIGRRWNIDPIVKIDESPYVTFRNNPILFTDFSGDDGDPYKVKKGDNLTKIAIKFGTTVDALATINGLKDPDKLKVGQILFVGSSPTPADAYKMVPHNDSYAEINKKHPQVSLAVSGAYSTALSLYTGSYNTYGSVDASVMNNLTEQAKQKDFTTNSPKTSAILIWEFLTGTGKQNRSFNESHPITNEIKTSESSRLAAWYMANKFNKGEFKDGITIQFYAGMAEGVGKIEALRRHINPYISSPATFYRGGMSYSMTRSGNDVLVKVTDAYTVYSMIRVKANIERIPGQTTPLGKTTVEFNFVWKDALKK